MTQAPPDGARQRFRRRTHHLSRRAYFLWAVGLFLLCGLIRAPFLDQHGLWADEVFSLAVATGHSLEHPANVSDASSGDYVEFPQAVSAGVYADHLEHDSPPANPARVVRAVFLSDTSPPGYYILLYLWTLGAGTSDLALRAFSLLWSMLAFPVVWSIARTLGGRWSAVMTGLAYAVAPVCVYYSVEGRMYSLLWFWAACLMWLSLHLHRREANRPTALAGWIAVATAGFLTHYFFIFPWMAACLWLLLHPGRMRRGWLVVAAVAVVVLVLPWYVRVPASLANWRVTGYWLDDPPANFNRLRETLLLAFQFFSPRGIWGLRYHWDILAAGSIEPVRSRCTELARLCRRAA